MKANTFASFSSKNVLTFAIFIFLAISSITLACDENSKIPTNSTKTNINYTYTSPSNSTQKNNFKTYIKNSCNSTTYPYICYKSLSPYASTIEKDRLKLCNVSLSVALKAARGASSAVSKLLNNNDNKLSSIGEEVVQDCFSNLEDSIEQLQDSLDAMTNLDSDFDREFQISNIKTWVSSAITNDQTCYDGFDEMNVDSTIRDKIRSKVLNVARKTSNALYFINNNIY
jgi:pectinesterase inhibitor-like protein